MWKRRLGTVEGLESESSESRYTRKEADGCRTGRGPLIPSVPTNRLRHGVRTRVGMTLSLSHQGPVLPDDSRTHSSVSVEDRRDRGVDPKQDTESPDRSGFP